MVWKKIQETRYIYTCLMRGKYFFHGVFYLLREEREREGGRKILIIRDKDGSMRPIPVLAVLTDHAARYWLQINNLEPRNLFIMVDRYLAAQQATKHNYFHG